MPVYRKFGQGVSKTRFNYLIYYMPFCDKVINHPSPSAVMGYSADEAPFVGTVPGRQNQYVIAGFTGHGMPQIFLSAKGLASMVLQGESFQNTGIPRIFEVTQQRLSNPRNAILEEWEATQRAVG